MGDCSYDHLKNGHKTWLDISLKKTYRKPRSTLKMLNTTSLKEMRAKTTVTPIRMAIVKKKKRKRDRGKGKKKERKKKVTSVDDVEKLECLWSIGGNIK